MFTAQLGTTLLWHGNRAVRRAGFVHAAQQLATRLPDVGYCINLCQGRLAFMLGFVAAALHGQTTLLPHSQIGSAVERLKSEHADSHTLRDDCLLGLDWQTPAINDVYLDPGFPLAVLYTSGSTGVPTGHRKTWRCLSQLGDLDAARFAADEPLNLVATVPPQHMYGLQTTVMLPFRSHCAIHDSQPFFPADIATALAQVPAPRALISTPTQLRACLASGNKLPELSFVLSATAPLKRDIAQHMESSWRTRVLEIYGCTEAGTVGTRRTTAGEAWTLTRGMRLEPCADGFLLQAEHLPAPQPLTDRIAPQTGSQFLLLGRTAEHIKIAGKRITLGDLTQALLGIEGVEDSVVFMPPGAARTAALVVAPGLSSRQILGSLASQVDPVFLPRPLLLVERLPRNEIGKLTAEALQAALARHAGHSDD